MLFEHVGKVVEVNELEVEGPNLGGKGAKLPENKFMGSINKVYRSTNKSQDLLMGAQTQVVGSACDLVEAEQDRHRLGGARGGVGTFRRAKMEDKIKTPEKAEKVGWTNSSGEGGGVPKKSSSRDHTIRRLRAF